MQAPIRQISNRTAGVLLVAPRNVVPGYVRLRRRRESRAAFDPVWGEWVVIPSPEFEAVGETVERKTRRGLPISKCSRVEEKK